LLLSNIIMESKKEIIKLLQEQLENIDSKNFNLDSWKKYNHLLLSRIFGADDEKVKQINLLEYEHSSWSLRDASGNDSYLGKTKKLAKEIIHAAIDEINAFGLKSKNSETKNEEANNLINFVFDELKGSQIKEINTILKGDLSKEEKKRQIYEIIADLDNRTKDELIANMIVYHSENI